MVAKAAAGNSDWDDWTKNYPKHKSKKSSNTILVEQLQKLQILEPFYRLFNEFGVAIKLEGVEKVFAQKKSKLKFKDHLKGVTYPRRIMYDAGVFYFKSE